MNKRTFHGKDVKFTVGENALGASRGLSLDISADTIDTTTRSSNGWTEHMPSVKSWTASTDGLYVRNEQALSAIKTAFLNDEIVPISMEFPDGATIDGEAIITSFPIEAPYDDAVTFSAEFQGTGRLNFADGTPADLNAFKEKKK